MAERLVQPSLIPALRRWQCTVASAMPSDEAISRTFLPSMTSSRTSASREEKQYWEHFTKNDGAWRWRSTRTA